MKRGISLFGMFAVAAAAGGGFVALRHFTRTLGEKARVGDVVMAKSQLVQGTGLSSIGFGVEVPVLVTGRNGNILIGTVQVGGPTTVNGIPVRFSDNAVQSITRNGSPVT